jgi:hypothetical protein
VAVFSGLADYWVLGSPLVAAGADQYANGHMQYYAQDVRAANGTTPFDFSVDPAREIGVQKRQPVSAPRRAPRHSESTRAPHA